MVVQYNKLIKYTYYIVPKFYWFKDFEKQIYNRSQKFEFEIKVLTENFNYIGTACPCDIN